MRISDWSSDVCSSDLISSARYAVEQDAETEQRDLRDIGLGRWKQDQRYVGNSPDHHDVEHRADSRLLSQRPPEHKNTEPDEADRLSKTETDPWRQTLVQLVQQFTDTHRVTTQDHPHRSNRLSGK